MATSYASLYVAVLLLATIQFLESSMLGFASTPIRGEIQASPEEYSFIAVLYACFAVISISKVRWFIERIGWRNYVLSSIALYLLGALICSFSDGKVSFSIGRIIMALGGGAFMTIGRLLANTLPSQLRFNGICFFATGVLLGTMGGSWVAALTVSAGHWQAMFWVLLFLASAVALLTIIYAPKVSIPRDSWTSSSLSFVFLLGLFSFFTLYLLQRSYYEFYSDRAILIFFAVLAMGGGGAIFYVERQRTRPLLRLKDFTTKRYLAGVGLFCVCYLLIGMNNYVQPQYLAEGLGYYWESIGEFQALAFLCTLIVWMPVMRLFLPKYPSPIKYWVFSFGSLAVYAWLFCSFSPVVDVWTHIVPALVLSGFFISAGMGTTAMQTFREFGGDEQLFAHAYQLKNMLGQIVQAVGTAGATIFMQWRQTVQYGNLNINMIASDPAYSRGIDELSKYISLTHGSKQAVTMAMLQQSQELSRQAILLAGIEYYWLVFWVSLAVMLISVLQRTFK